jgi:hypothetical protein
MHATQRVEEEAPNVVEYVPVAQFRQKDFAVAPITLENRPGKQVKQKETLDAWLVVE